MPNLSEMLGMGIAIQLRNAFSAPAAAITTSSRNLTTALTTDAKRVNDGWKFMAAGGAMMFLGTGMLGFLAKAGHESLDTAAKFQVLRAQIGALTKDDHVADALFASAKKFTLNAPFQIDQVTTAMKTLLAFGIKSQDVMKDLATSGNWASLMTMPGGIEKAANIIGRIHSGNLGYAMRSAQAFGISYADIAAQNPALINPKTRTTAKGADPSAFLDAFLKAINEKFGDGMQRYMRTLPGMITNLKDQWILMMADMGKEILPIIQDSLGGILNVLSRTADLIHPFAVAMGDALGMVAKWVIYILTPIGHLVVWVMELAKERPGLFKLGVGLIAVAGALLNVAGAALIALGAYRLLSFMLGGATYVEELAAMFTGMLGPLALVIAGGVVFYQIWTRNLLGVRDMLMGYWGTIRVVFQGVWSLLMSLHGGVGTMSVDLANKLKKAGLFDIVVILFMAAYRIRAVLIGIGEGFEAFLTGVSYVFAGLIRMFQPVLEMGRVVLDVGLGLLGIGDKLSPNKWEDLGRVIGFVGTALLIYKAISISTSIAMALGSVIAWGVRGAMFALQLAFNAATLASMAFRGAMWLLNLAMDANPVGIIITVIAALIGVVIWAIVKHKELGEEIKKCWAHVPAGVRSAIASTASFAFAWTDHWNNIKNIVQTVITWFKTEWETVLNWLASKLETIMAFLKTPADSILGRLATSVMQPVHMPAMHLTASQSELLAHPVLSFSELLAQNRAAIQAQEATQHAAATQPHPPIQVHSTIRLDGKKVGQAVTTHQQSQVTGGK